MIALSFVSLIIVSSWFSTCHAGRWKDYDSPWVWDEIKQHPTTNKPEQWSTFMSKLTTNSPPFEVPVTSWVSPTPTNGKDSSTTTSPGTPSPCPNCFITPEYNPVCGTDRITYNNPGLLRCANVCGANVDVLFHGACEPQ